MAADDEAGRSVAVSLESLGGFRFRVDFVPSGAELVMDEPERDR